jgi:hypothetical protein
LKTENGKKTSTGSVEQLFVKQTANGKSSANKNPPVHFITIASTSKRVLLRQASKIRRMELK